MKRVVQKAWSLVVVLLFSTILTCSNMPNAIALGQDDTLTDSITVTYPYYAFVENPEDPWETVWEALDATDTVEYSDSYFDESSPGDHPELRVVSYALALAGFENKADGYPSSSLTPNPKLHAFLDELGFHDYQEWDISSEKDGHSMGTTIAQKTLPDGKTLIAVAPRNYNYMTEWLSNFNVGTTGDHAGFTESANFIKDRLDEYIRVKQPTNYKIWMVGYSRGGAVVDLVAKKINENLADYDMSAEDFYVYTFGAPKASLAEPGYANIHDVKDGNDLLLGYMFPEQWGFHNTGTYEEIHPADLVITTSVVDISDIIDSTKISSALSRNEGFTTDVGTMNGLDFMNAWTEFVNENGLTRDYFDSTVKPPLSAVMQAYQLRTLDKQGEFTDFITDTNKGLAGMVAGNAFYDLMANYGGDISIFPAYLDLVEVLKGTADDADVDELITILTGYMGEYDDYESKMGQKPAVTEDEFNILKENLPKLVKALAPILIADAKYTQETYGEDSSLYYTYTLVSNAENLVIGHIPESLMPLLKSLVPPDDPGGDEPVEPDVPVPNTGESYGGMRDGAMESHLMTVIFLGIGAGILIAKKRHQG